MAAAKRPHNAYPKAMREKIVALAKTGKTPKELAAQFPPSVASIANWINEAAGKPPRWRVRPTRGTHSAPTTMTLPPSGAYEHLAAESQALREERDYLKNTLMWLVFKLAPQ